MLNIRSELKTVDRISGVLRELTHGTEHGEQVFESAQYSTIAQLFKPKGGGGTRVSCVSEYINSRAVKTEAVIVFTDGHVEDNVKWEINAPTLWLVTHSRRFNPPSGNKVMVKE
jgi:predicted metal-dependent peptidase